MKKFTCAILSLLLLSLSLTACSSQTPLQGKTITTDIASMTVPEEATNIVSYDVMQAYMISNSSYYMTITLMTGKGTPSTVGSFSDSVYQEYVSTAKEELKSQFSSNDALKNATFSTPDTYKTLKINGQDAIKVTVNFTADTVSGAYDVYFTGNSSNTVVIAIFTLMNSKGAELPAVIDQMIDTVKFE